MNQFFIVQSINWNPVKLVLISALSQSKVIILLTPANIFF